MVPTLSLVDSLLVEGVLMALVDGVLRALAM